MYKSLCANYSAGHTKINIVGFSRGAALALDFANLVAKRGVPVNLGFLKFQEWDLGHNLALPKDVTVERCYHALALDERRQTFMVTRVAGAHESAAEVRRDSQQLASSQGRRPAASIGPQAPPGRQRSGGRRRIRSGP